MTLSYLFGSRIRGDEGKFSDKDALVISKNWTKANTEIDYLRNKNYDVSFFDLDKSSLLLNAGSLFFKHIIDEGELVNGDSEASKALLNKWEPKKTYSKEIEHNINLLEALYYLPKNDMSNLIANDILIISIRNILIRKFAERGIYKFAWEEIFDTAINHKIVNEKEKDLLLTSKICKNIYRKGQNFIIGDSFVIQLKCILEKITSKKISINYVSNQVIKKRTNLLSSFDYKHLRYLEILTSLYPTIDNSEELNFLKKIFKNPNYVSNSNLSATSRNLAY